MIHDFKLILVRGILPTAVQPIYRAINYLIIVHNLITKFYFIAA